MELQTQYELHWYWNDMISNLLYIDYVPDEFSLMTLLFENLPDEGRRVIIGFVCAFSITLSLHFLPVQEAVPKATEAAKAANAIAIAYLTHIPISIILSGIVTKEPSLDFDSPLSEITFVFLFVILSVVLSISQEPSLPMSISFGAVILGIIALMIDEQLNEYYSVKDSAGILFLTLCLIGSSVFFLYMGGYSQAAILGSVLLELSVILFFSFRVM